MPKLCVFTFPDGNRFRRTVFLFDQYTQEVRAFKDKRLDFNDTLTVLVKKELFVFEQGSPVAVHKYRNFFDAELLIMTKLASLVCVEHLELFRVANYADESIFLTGGYDAAL